MPMYMFQGRYTPASLNAMVSAPQDREAAAGALIEAMGGKVSTVDHVTQGILIAIALPVEK